MNGFSFYGPAALASLGIGTGIAMLQGDIQVSAAAVVVILAFGVLGMQSWTNFRELARLKKEAEMMRSHTHKWRNNYMLILNAMNLVSHMVYEVAKDDNTRARLRDIHDEVARQLADTRKEQDRLEGPFVKAP